MSSSCRTWTRGAGWLIFGLPPAEIAVHPSKRNDLHELYFMCDDIAALVAELQRHDLPCAPIQDQGWGRVIRVTLPGGGTLGIYEPRHARPDPVAAAYRMLPCDVMTGRSFRR